MRVIVSGASIPEGLVEVAAQLDVELDPIGADPSRAELAAVLPGATGYFLGGDEFLDAALLKVATGLRFISFAGTGASAFVDVKAADTLGIEVMTTPGANAVAVAEFALGQGIALQRGLLASVASSPRLEEKSTEIRGTEFGVFGLGTVGLECARLLLAVGGAVRYASRKRHEEAERALGIRHVERADLFADCLTIVVACELNDDTSSSIGRAELAAGVRYLVSVADPCVLNWSAVADALDDGTLLGVAQDGDLWTERVLTPELRERLQRHAGVSLFVSAHIAAKTTASWTRMEDAAIENLRHVLAEHDD
ncbi:NAD(P)-dependent oxidoreductase [Curtobacterium sp. PhB136]|uniref:NAD(P)-dependent oxidoreductase n=1 Tax=Curtobacterium sp. PhB136 TaxID=2485181 RepID=UPI00105337D7|nr:NAD(P)-dependent oxidoreductase [Curtobacterium sp. PhB136]TCK65756.1 lactate dehydrogenase-like 2-hydroxyacid dehydrogenase [Curtobacterium sp. PhB136]